MFAPSWVRGASPYREDHFALADQEARNGNDEFARLMSNESPFAPSARVLRFAGAAGAFAALAQVAEKHPGGALLLAVDSFIGVEALTERALRPPSPWLLEGPFPAEGAAALAELDAGTVAAAKIILRP